MVIDNDGEGLPYIRDPAHAILHGVRDVDGLVEIKPGAKLDMRFDRQSWNDLRRRDRVRRANAR